jgi:hypothetical protein
MHFQLPQNLIAQVVAYDPVLKPLARTENANGPHKSPRMTLGLPTRLFPVEFLTEAEQLQYVTDFNQREDRDRAVIIDNDKGCGLLAYKSSMWIATWFFNKDQNKDYLCGVTYAYKATPTIIARVEGPSGDANATIGWKSGVNGSISDPQRFFDYADAVEVKYGRITMIERTLYITKDLVFAGIDRLPMDSTLGGYGRRDQHKRGRFHQWRTAFRRHLGSWSDENNCFTRILENNDVRRCVFNNTKMEDTDSFVDIMITKIIERSGEGDKLKPLLQTPFFKKEANEVFNKTLSIYMNPDTDSRRDVGKPYHAFQARMGRVVNFLRIYPDATLDHCQQMYKLVNSVYRLPIPHEPAVIAWLHENMPIASYISIVEKKVTAAREEWANNPKTMERARDYSTDEPTVSLTELDDTLQMLSQLHAAQNKGKDRYADKDPLKLEKPNRWRLTEFHDYLVGECFKLNTPNEKLHQDLFKEPVKLEHNGQKWTFFQPQDIHQLASWGRAVRNCVGSADSYRNGIKKKTHFIVLAMIDNQPRFTIQLKVNNGVLNVEQIADICNRSLPQAERDNYQAAFGKALKILDQQITEAQQ